MSPWGAVSAGKAAPGCPQRARAFNPKTTYWRRERKEPPQKIYLVEARGVRFARLNSASSIST